MKRPLVILIAAVAACVVIFFACRGHNQSAADTGSPQQPQKVAVRMKWFFAGTMAGWFAGRDQGFFKEQGIDLQITSGGPDNNSVKLVAAGSDLFGVAGADEVLMAREKGIPVVAIGVLFKESPICFISRKERGIKSPKDWTGKTVEVSFGSNAEIQYRALVKMFDVKDIKEVPYTFNPVPLLEGKVDVSVAYRMDQVVTLERQGVSLDIITAKEYGINPYGDVVITTEKTLKEQPELVQKFMLAVVKSFQWSIEHPEEAVKALVKTVPELKLENELAVWNATQPFLLEDGGLGKLGVMDEQRWKQSMDILLEFKALKAPLDLANAYKNQQ